MKASSTAVKERLHRYLSRHQSSGEAYEFGIKIRKVNIPDKVREKLSEAQIQDAFDSEASQRLDAFMEQLKDDFPWILRWRQDGRSGGWLVIEPDAAALDDYGNVEDVRFAKKRLNDLNEITRRVEASKRDFVDDMQSGEWWGVHPKKQFWSPRER
jgi:hypothetical protein